MIENKMIKEIGLSDNEIKIYELLLSNGEIGIKEIIAGTKITRAGIYNILKSLEIKNLIREGEYRGKKTFAPNSPMILNEIYEDKIKKIKDEQFQLKSILPKLLVEYRITRKTPLVATYKGLEGLKKVYDYVLKVRKPLFIFASYFDRQKKEFSDLINEQIKKQARLKIKVKALGSIKEYSKKYWEFAQRNNIDIKVTDEINLFPSQILIFDNNVAYTVFEGEFSTTLIYNPHIAKTMKIIFDLVWQKALKPKIINKSANKY